MNLPQGKRELSGDLKDINSILKNLPNEFKGAVHIFMKVKNRSYEGDVLIRDNSIIAASLVYPDKKRRISKETAFEEMKSKIEKATGTLDVYLLTDNQMKISAQMNAEAFLESAVDMSQFIEEIKLKGVEKKEEKIEGAKPGEIGKEAPLEEVDKTNSIKELENEWKKLEEEWKKLEEEVRPSKEEIAEKEESKEEEPTPETEELKEEPTPETEELEEEPTPETEELKEEPTPEIEELKEEPTPLEIKLKELPEVEEITPESEIIPKLKKKIGFVDKLRFIGSKKSIIILEFIDGKTNLEEISNETGIDLPTTKKLIDGLVKGGYVILKSG